VRRWLHWGAGELLPFSLTGTHMSNKIISRITPVLVVEAVEPCAQFWQQLGFTRSAEVPHGDTLGFVIMAGDGIELMYQSADSVQADDANIASKLHSGGTSLFVEVPNLEAAVKAVSGAPVIMAERKTFYGMREIGVLDPGGNVVLFAQRIE
jgi:hypothetical protein